MSIVLCIAMGVLALSVLSLLEAASFLKSFSSKDSDAAEARYHSKAIGLAVVVCGIFAYIGAEATVGDPGHRWIPYLLIIAAEILVGLWWLMWSVTVRKLRAERAAEKERRNVNG